MHLLIGGSPPVAPAWRCAIPALGILLFQSRRDSTLILARSLEREKGAMTTDPEGGIQEEQDHPQIYFVFELLLDELAVD